MIQCAVRSRYEASYYVQLLKNGRDVNKSAQRIKTLQDSFLAAEEADKRALDN